jgi:hypothetical protein
MRYQRAQRAPCTFADREGRSEAMKVVPKELMLDATEIPHNRRVTAHGVNQGSAG